MENNKLRNNQLKVLRLAKLFDDVCKENNIDYTLSSGSILGAIRHKGFIPWDYDMDVLVPINQYENMREKLLTKIQEENDLVLHLWDKEKKYSVVADRLGYLDIPHEEVHLDIFPLIGAPKDEKKQKKFANLCYYSYKILRCKHCNTKYSKPSHVKKIKMIKPLLFIVPDKIIIKWYNYLQHKYDFSKSEFVHILASGYGVSETLKKDIYLNTFYSSFEDIKLRIPVKYKEYLEKVYGKDYMTPKKDGYKKIDKKGKNA